MIEFIAESEAGRQLKMWPIRVKSYETQRHEARLSPFSWLQYHTALNFDREHPSLSLSPLPRSSLTLPLISGQCRVRLKARIAPRYRTNGVYPFTREKRLPSSLSRRSHVSLTSLFSNLSVESTRISFGEIS